MATRARVAEMFPDRRWGTPDDIANLVEFLAGDTGAWLRDQVPDTEGGFDRFHRPDLPRWPEGRFSQAISAMGVVDSLEDAILALPHPRTH